MSKKIPLSIYVATNAPESAHQILSAWGARMPNDSSPLELGNALSMLLNIHGSGVLEDLAHNHPDKDLVLAVEQTHQNLLMQRNPSNQNNQFSNACGCSGFSSCDGGCKCGGKCKGASSFNGDDSVVEKFTVFDHPMDGDKGKTVKSESGIYPVVLFGLVISGLLFVVANSK